MILNHCRLTAKQTSNLQPVAEAPVRRSPGPAPLPAGPAAPQGIGDPGTGPDGSPEPLPGGSTGAVQGRECCHLPSTPLPHPSLHRAHRCLTAALSESPAMNFRPSLSPPVIVLKSLIRCPFVGERKKLDGRKNRAGKLGRFTK